VRSLIDSRYRPYTAYLLDDDDLVDIGACKLFFNAWREHTALCRITALSHGHLTAFQTSLLKPAAGLKSLIWKAIKCPSEKLIEGYDNSLLNRLYEVAVKWLGLRAGCLPASSSIRLSTGGIACQAIKTRNNSCNVLLHVTDAIQNLLHVAFMRDFRNVRVSGLRVTTQTPSYTRRHIHVNIIINAFCMHLQIN
jgi:hypothetical protein